LKVSGKYEDDHWLAMNGNSKEWAVGFHGLRRDVKDSVKSIS
jgi:hypothetical protein